MIYVFRALGEACACPGRSCSALCQLSERFFAACASGKLPRRCCGELCTAFAEWREDCFHCTERPLVSLVVITGMLSLGEIYFCASALGDASLSDCIMNGSPLSVITWLRVQIMFALTHFVFAFYLQSRLLHKLLEIADGLPAPQMMTLKQVRAGFKEVLLYDVGVLLFCLCSLGAFTWSVLGSEWIGNGVNCNPKTYSSRAYSLGPVALAVTFAYTAAWYCCACSGSIELPALGSPYSAALQSARLARADTTGTASSNEA